MKVEDLVVGEVYFDRQISCLICYNGTDSSTYYKFTVIHFYPNKRRGVWYDNMEALYFDNSDCKSLTKASNLVNLIYGAKYV